jgi:hypothetical protein
MVVFEKTGCGAASMRTVERTPAAITLPDHSLDARGNMAGRTLGVTGWSWTCGRSEFRSFKLRQE